MKSRFALLVGVLVIASMLLTACPAPVPQVVEKVVTQIVEQKVEVVQTVRSRRRSSRLRSSRRSSRRPRRPKPSRLSPGCSMTRATWIPRAMSVWATNTCARPSPSSTRPSRASGSGTISSLPGTRKQKLVAAVQAAAEVPDIVDLQAAQVNAITRTARCKT